MIDSMMREGSAALAAALLAHGGHTSIAERFRAPVGASRLTGLGRISLQQADRRRIASSAEPCTECSVRGDFPDGCAHQRPDPDWLTERTNP